MVERKGERVRLYVRGTILGYKRSKSNQYPSTSLLQIEGVNTSDEVNWYLGKRLAYVYKAKTKKNGSQFRCVWGKVARPHGSSGVVRARFRNNLPPSSLVSLSVPILRNNLSNRPYILVSMVESLHCGCLDLVVFVKFSVELCEHVTLVLYPMK
uniref:Uncharacterized protein n=1 Tax=Physcomitrium patens TaxID=3218 RepID=A0A7I4AA35_PHYPA